LQLSKTNNQNTMSKTPSLKFNVVHSVTSPKSAGNADSKFMQQPRQFKIASRPAPMARADDGKPRPANRPASEGN
jgi:hypothetical protein